MQYLPGMRYTLLALLLAVVTGCASSPGRPASVTAPEIAVQQTGSIFFGSSQTAPVSIDVAVRNTSNVPLRLRTVRLDAAGMSQYSIYPAERTMNELLPPGETRVVSLFATAYTNRSRLSVTEPLSVRAVVDLEHEGKRFREVALRPMISQP